MSHAVHVIGASGRSGAALCRALAAAGLAFVPLVRDAARWVETGITAESRQADLTEHGPLREALADARIVVSCAHARYAGAILAASPPDARFVFLGSTRKFTNWPDAHARGVLGGEASFLMSRRPGIMLHPTMIYGADGEDNVQRLAALLRRLPFVPLPAGGRALVQPIHQSDVTHALLAALSRDWPEPKTMVIAGPQAMPYADFVRAVASAAGLPPPRLMPVPAWLLTAGALVTRLPMLPTVRGAEIRRLLEDKAFDITPMRRVLGVSPIPLEDGLGLTFRIS
jgi:nucleoside-diphosphate-sugar epimerase